MQLIPKIKKMSNCIGFVRQFPTSGSIYGINTFQNLYSIGCANGISHFKEFGKSSKDPSEIDETLAGGGEEPAYQEKIAGRVRPVFSVSEIEKPNRNGLKFRGQSPA